MVRPAVLWRDPDPTMARHWPPMCVSAGRRAVIIKILPRRLSGESGRLG
jgi:hypothetical protein